MILYSIIPAEMVFEGFEGDDRQIGFIEMEYRGEKVLTSALGGNRYVISRLISTSPKAYLDPAFQPGTIIYK